MTEHQASVSYPTEGNAQCFSVEDNSFWFQHRNALLAEIVRLFPAEGPIFDVGGGNGFVAMGLEAAGFPCVLVEPGRTGAGNALKRGLTNVICSTIEGAKFRPESMSAVGLFDVVEHIEDDGAFLQTLHSLMTPGGRLYVTVPAFRALWSRDDDQAGHYRRYSTGSLTASLEKAGFTVDYVSYFCWFLVAPILILRALPSVLGLRTAQSVEATQREHTAGSGLLSSVVTTALDAERRRMMRKKTMPFGSSCLAVARRA